MTGNRYFKNRIGNLRTILIGVLIFALLLSACEAKKHKVYRVGILSGADFFLSVVEGFKSNMTKLGYVENQNIVYNIIIKC